MKRKKQHAPDNEYCETHCHKALQEQSLIKRQKTGWMLICPSRISNNVTTAVM